MTSLLKTTAKLGVVACAVFAAQAQADTISRLFGGSDCAGYFGDNFSSCTIFTDNTGERVELSPVIAKYEPEEGEWETNVSVYPTVDGTEFTLFPSGAGETGTWEYDRNIVVGDPGASDPGVRYWAVKAGGEFILNWDVDGDATAAGGACDGSTDLYSLACLSEANVVTTGSWVTPQDKELSHITFYDTEVLPPSEVPLPAAAWLFGSALLGLLGVARRRA